MIMAAQILGLVSATKIIILSEETRVVYRSEYTFHTFLKNINCVKLIHFFKIVSNLIYFSKAYYR
jgi:hypothetical protein